MILPAVSLFAESLMRKAQMLIVSLLTKWMWLFFILLLGHFRRSMLSYLYSRPTKTSISGLPTVFGQWITSLFYHMASSRTVHDGYIKV